MLLHRWNSGRSSFQDGGHDDWDYKIVLHVMHTAGVILNFDPNENEPGQFSTLKKTP